MHSCKCSKRKNLRTIWSSLKLEWITNNLLQFLGTKEQREVKLVLKPERKLLKFPMRKLMKSFIEINRRPNKSQIKIKPFHTHFSYASSSTPQSHCGIRSLNRVSNWRSFEACELVFHMMQRIRLLWLQIYTGCEDVLGPLQTWTEYKYGNCDSYTWLSRNAVAGRSLKEFFFPFKNGFLFYSLPCNTATSV